MSKINKVVQTDGQMLEILFNGQVVLPISENSLPKASDSMHNKKKKKKKKKKPTRSTSY